MGERQTRAVAPPGKRDPSLCDSMDNKQLASNASIVSSASTELRGDIRGGGSENLLGWLDAW